MMLISFVAPADHLSLPSPVLSFSHRRLGARTPSFEGQRASPACALSTAAMTQNIKHGRNYCEIQQRVAVRVPWGAYLSRTLNPKENIDDREAGQECANMLHDEAPSGEDVGRGSSPAQPQELDWTEFQNSCARSRRISLSDQA